MRSDPKEVRRRRLIAAARRNPHEFFTFEECGEILGFGQCAMTTLANAGVPTFARKMNPGQVCAWIALNSKTLGKVNAR